MKRLILILIVLLGYSSFGLVLKSGIPPRKPFVTLIVNKKTYQPDAEITVRPGEKVVVQAQMWGGRRDYCWDPGTYANVGPNTLIESRGENGMSFRISGGSFRGTWSLTKETAQLTSSAEVKITLNPAVGNLQTIAVVEVPKSGVQKVFLKVTSETKWHYVRITPGGKTEEDDTNKAESTFYLKIEGDAASWYNSANIAVKGTENFSVRTRLDEVQRFYNETNTRLSKKDFKGAQMMIDNLKTTITSLKTAIDAEKQKNSSFQCDVTFIGLPTSVTMQNIQKFQTMADKYKEMFSICQGNMVKIDEMLRNKQNQFSANIVKSVFKNYIDWGTSIPSGAPDLLTIYDPNNRLTPFDIPRKVMGWWETANNDASILKDQAQTIKILTQLREFYVGRCDLQVKESKVIYQVINDLKPAKDMDALLKGYFSSLSWAKWRAA